MEILSVTLFIVLIIFINALLSLFSKPTSKLYCGIVGFSGPKNSSKFDLNKLKTLLYINSLERGKDSVGIYSPKNGIQKEAKEFKNIIADSDNFIDNLVADNVIIAHVRAKTIGVNNIKNAHPWEYDNIVGLHNGTLQYYYSLATEYGISHADYDVDSQVLLMALDKNFSNMDKDLFKALEQYEGAAALLMYHKERETIFACHDKERPLFYGYIGKSMYISSIEASLQIIGCKKITSFEENFVYEIKDGIIVNKVAYTPQARVVKPVYSRQISAEKTPFTPMEIKLSSTYLNQFFDGYDSNGNIIIDRANFPSDFKATGCNSGELDLSKFSYFPFRLQGKNVTKVYNHITNTQVSVDSTLDVFEYVEAGSLPSTVKIMNIDTLEVIDVYKSMLNLGYFLHIPLNYAIPLQNIHYTKSNNLICFKGDIVRILNVNYTNSTVKCICISDDPKHKVVFSAPIDLFIPATEEEVSNWMSLCAPLTKSYMEGSKSEITVVEEGEVVTDTPTCGSMVLQDPMKIIENIQQDEELEEEEDSPMISMRACDFELFVKEIVLELSDIDAAIGREDVDINDIQIAVKELISNVKDVDWSDIVN